MITGSALRSDLQESRDRLFTSIRGMNEEQFRFMPAGERWCLATHLTHLLRIERVFTDRARRALTEETPAIESTAQLNDDDPGLAQRLAVPQIIHGMQAARRELNALLDACDDRALARTVIHARIGVMSIADIARKMATHEEEHAADVLRLVKLAPTAGRVIIPLARRS